MTVACICVPGSPYATWHEARVAPASEACLPDHPACDARETGRGPRRRTRGPLDDLVWDAFETLYLAWCVLDPTRTSDEPRPPNVAIAAVDLVRHGEHWTDALRLACLGHDGANSKPGLRLA